MKKLKNVQGSRFKAQGKKTKTSNLEPRTSNQTSDLLLEIGAEEIPAAYLDGAVAQLREEAEKLFRDAHIAYQAVESFGTPRRLVLLVREMASTQHNPAEEIRGPSKQASFDASGKPTPALLGFLKSRGGSLAQTKLVDTGKGSYVYLLKSAKQVPTASVLPQLLGQLITRLRFPKTMRWDDSGARFARPVRWLVALYGSKAVRVTFGRVVSGTKTWIGGPKRPRALSITSPAHYMAALKRAGIMLDLYQREAHINRLVKAAAKQHGGIPVPEMVSHGLLDEVNALVEQPVALVGQCDERYLMLPRELLLASMAKYQRVFAMQSKSGQLLPKFVGILDGKPGKINDVRRQYEFILNARLADSLLFLSQDRKQLPLDSMAKQLKDISFNERLGSMEHKTDRIQKVSVSLEGLWRLSPEESSQLRRACQLAKADLVSTMVKEFPTLQGIVGKYYALDSKEPQAVAEAIEEHYLPTGTTMPKTLLGSALALLDKYDTLASYFAIDIMPTGDQDPYGLRRAAQGVVEIAWKIHRPLSLDVLFKAWQASAPFAQHKPQLASKIQVYLQERFYTFAWPAPAPSKDLIDAVLGSASDDLVDTMDRIRALRQMDGKQSLLRAAKVIERTHNILKGAKTKPGDVDPARLQEPPERALWDRYQAAREEVLRLIRSRSYAEATTAYGETFFDPIQEFFERVMVNVPDEGLQQNRLALMKAINVLYTDHIADLSKLAILQPRQTL